ncbi:MAG: hypothetical protein KF754_04460 [Planctomycetes bacterium]|nr:hypothetical protein [Planctomycetota bacterium]
MRTYIQACVAVAMALALSWHSPVSAQAKPDKKAQREAWDAAEKLLKDAKAPVADVVAAVEKLQPVIDHDMALNLLGYFDQCDNAWSSDKKDNLGRPVAGPRPVEAYQIARAILRTVRSMDNAEEAAKFEKEIGDREKFSLRQRTAMLDAIARNFEDKRCADIMLAWTKDAAKDTDMRVLIIHHLADHPRAEGVLDALLVTLLDRSWRIREVSILALVECSDTEKDRVTLAMIQALAKESGKLRKTLGDALARITGADKGTNADAWIDWFKEKKREEQGLPPKSGKGDRGTAVKVFETESFSDRYVFVIDTSVSMKQIIKDEEKERLKKSMTEKADPNDKRKPLDWTQINSKLDLAREEMIRSLEVMDPTHTKFTLVSFDIEAKVWKEELVPTDAKNVKEAADWLRKIAGGNRTNVFAALNAALDLSEKLAGVDVDKRKGKPAKPPKDGKVVTGPHADEAIPDTIFLYTDGYATNGKYAGDDRAWQGKSQDEKAKLYSDIMKYMIEEIGDRNRVSRIQIHCIGVGSPQDSTTMGALARVAKGKYVPIGR